ncbi:YfdX family protein [Roseibium aggregatum]|uniref:YfdX family protein n=1 Tax=Roseibium aggregatum TaxID=187304 RepID=A0A926P5W2_9HYPH|nr:YfdX family protein [Roseibium aggregatum]MBD1548696.1 YfdX family protein [Roseibium aggregatum]
MKSRTAIASLVAATLVGATALTSAAVYAAEASHQTEAAKMNQAASNVADNFLKLSKDGMEAMSDVHKARLAIYNGNTDEAETYINTAQSLAMQAEKDVTTLDKLAKAGNKTTKGGDISRYLPLSAQISVLNDYALNPEDSDHLDKANTALKNGDNKGAVSHASLIDQQVAYTYVAVPYDQLTASLYHAGMNLKNKKAQLANMDLKAIEDSLVADRVSIDGIPDMVVQG